MADLSPDFKLFFMPASCITGPCRTASWPQLNTNLHLVHTVAGHGVLRIGDQRYTTSPQNVLAVPRRQPCLWDKTSQTDWEMINLHYEITLSCNQTIDKHYAMPIVFQPKGLTAIHRNLRRSCKQWHEGHTMPQLEVSANMHALAIRYWSQHSELLQQPRPRDHAIEQVCHLLEQHPDTPYTAETLADVVHLSTSQMNRRFRSAMGMSPKVYWQQQRLSFCRRALREHNQPLERLAPSLGFNDVSYFNRWFHQQTGITPGEYRRRSRTLDL